MKGETVFQLPYGTSTTVFGAPLPSRSEEVRQSARKLCCLCKAKAVDGATVVLSPDAQTTSLRLTPCCSRAENRSCTSSAKLSSRRQITER